MFKFDVELHKLLIVEFSPFLHEASSSAYCQEEHLGISGYLWGNAMGIYNNFE